MIKQFFSLLMIATLMISCDTNEDNDPNTVCDADFYTLASTHWSVPPATFDIYRYQKSDVFTNPENLSSNNNFFYSGSTLSAPNSCISSNGNKLVFTFAFEPAIYKLDLTTQNIAIENYHGWKAPEFLGNTLSFLKFENNFTNFTLVDENENALGSTSGNIDLSDAGPIVPATFLATSDLQDKIYYLANSKILVYNHSNDTWQDYLIETYDDTSNKVFFKGIEYTGNNTVMVLKVDETDTNNISFKLLKIDLSNNTPQITVLKDLTGQLSISESDLLTGRWQISSAYDACDNNYYFMLGNINDISTYMAEIKLDSNIIKEYQLQGRLLYGLEVK